VFLGNRIGAACVRTGHMSGTPWSRMDLQLFLLGIVAWRLARSCDAELDETAMRKVHSLQMTSEVPDPNRPICQLPQLTARDHERLNHRFNLSGKTGRS
jgi:hypothetical protein